MKIKYFQIDAFTNQIFSGNPAGVCPLEDWLDDDIMQKIAQENNLSETAFFVKTDLGYNLRWFTPEKEVDLCGHATLASAWVLFNIIKLDSDELKFDTRSGELSVHKHDSKLEMNFPISKLINVKTPDKLSNGLGIDPIETFLAVDYMVILESEDAVRNIKPNIAMLEELNCRGIIATAPGDDCDFVSRFFAPRYGINEDPVTGSAHCQLTPYWAQKLNKNHLKARQVSSRGGEIACHLLGDRVKLTGECVMFMEGVINI